MAQDYSLTQGVCGDHSRSSGPPDLFINSIGYVGLQSHGRFTLWFVPLFFLTDAIILDVSRYLSHNSSWFWFAPSFTDLTFTLRLPWLTCFSTLLHLLFGWCWLWLERLSSERHRSQAVKGMVSLDQIPGLSDPWMSNTLMGTRFLCGIFHLAKEYFCHYILIFGVLALVILLSHLGPFQRLSCCSVSKIQRIFLLQIASCKRWEAIFWPWSQAKREELEFILKTENGLLISKSLVSAETIWKKQLHWVH